MNFANSVLNFIQHPAVKVDFRKLLGIVNVNFEAASHLLITHPTFVKYLKTNVNTIKQRISCFYTSRKFMIQIEGKFCIIFSYLVSP